MGASKNYIKFIIAAIFVIQHTVDCLSRKEIETCVKAHNKLRHLHVGTPSLVWDAGIAAKAQKYAEHLLALRQGMIHDKNKNGLGENLYWADSSKPATCAKASLAWYDEIKDYDYSTAGSKNGKPVGHFTQLVWKNTQRFGVGIAVGTSRYFPQYGNVETYVVAKYGPTGNFYWRGQRLQDYAANVRPRKHGAVTPTLAELEKRK